MLTLRCCNHFRNVNQGVELRSLFSSAGQLRFWKHDINVLLGKSGIPYKADRSPEIADCLGFKTFRHRCGDETLNVSRVDLSHVLLSECCLQSFQTTSC